MNVVLLKLARQIMVLAIMLSLFGVGAAIAQDTPAASPDTPAEAEHAPKIVCAEPSFNFGDKDESETVEHAYLIKNEGDLTLEIGNVRTSCGCTVANISNKSVAPGETTEVTARLSLRGRRGAQHKAITVESNDPKTPQLQLTLEGNSSSQLHVNPAQIFFGQIDENAQTSSIVNISGEEGFNVVKVESSSPNFEPVVEIVETGKNFNIVVSTKGPLPRGGLSGNIRVSTDSAKFPAVDIPVSVTVLNDLMVAPDQIILVEKAGEGVTRYVVVRPGKTKQFEVQTVEAPDPSIQVQVTSMGENGYQVRLDNLVATKDLDGKKIKILTNVEGMKEIDIPFKIIPANPAVPTPTPAS